MNKHEVKCINKSHRYDPHERITHVGGYGNGKNWKITQERAVQGIETGEFALYVTIGGRYVNVIVARSRYGHKYIKTEADGDHPNNLLSLYECV